MPPPYEAYQQQVGYGQYPAYGQAQTPNEAFQMQQQQPMPAPSVSSPLTHQSQQNQQIQWRNQSAYNYQQQFVPPPQHQNYQLPSQQTPQFQQSSQYQHSSPLQQFTSRQLGTGQSNQQQQYWPQTAQGLNYSNQYQPIQSQAQSVQNNGQFYQQPSHDLRQPAAASPTMNHRLSLDQTGCVPVNAQRPPQQATQPSHSQQVQAAPGLQRQPSVSSRPHQVSSTSDPRYVQQKQQDQQQQQRPRHQQQRTPSQPSGQQRSQQVHHTNGTAVRDSVRQPTQTPQAHSQTVHTPQSIPNSRVLTHVEIPVYRPIDMSQTPQQRSVKRRRSNDGASISLSQPQKQQPPIQKPSTPVPAYVHIPKPTQSSPLTDLASSQVVPPTPPPDVDYQSVLLSLSDEYVSAAHSMSARLCSPDATDEDLSYYHQLIATALGCLESLIKNYRLRDARKEARVRLRFASLLFEETEETVAAEECLSKGITFCERNRLTDTKYAMHHLLVRVMHKTNATAATRTLEKLIHEVETMGLTPWIYAFRFLRVSLSVQSGGPSDASAVLRHLAALIDHADAYQHTGVQVAAATLDAIVHLQSGDNMAADIASRSLASARTHQLGSVMNELPQLRATIDILELACAFMQSSPPDQTAQKMIQFHQSLDAKSMVTGWTTDGSFSLPLGVPSIGDVEADTGGIFRSTSKGELALAFMWFTRSQLYMIGYMLGGISKMNKNGEDRKSETFLAEGLKLNRPFVDASAMSIKTTEASKDMQQRVAIAIKLLQIFAYCSRAGWDTALAAIDTLDQELSKFPHYRDEYTDCSLLYLSAVCNQALGDDITALMLYKTPQLSLQPNPHKAVTPLRDLQTLAALNSISIMRFHGDDPSAPEKLLADLAPYCEASHNKGIFSAWHILRAHDPDPSTTIIKVKQCIQAALRPAQATKNARIMAIIMNTMTEQFFDGIMGKQALQSASAGKKFGRGSADSLWASVGDGIHRDTLVRSGDMAGAAQAELQVQIVMEKVPARVKDKLPK